MAVKCKTQPILHLNNVGSPVNLGRK